MSQQSQKKRRREKRKMYYRIKNMVDARAISGLIGREGMDITIGERIQEIADTLDSAYGSHRSANAYGGYIIFFKTRECYEELIEELNKFYNIDPEEKEYLDYIGENGEWCEELYQFTEDALVFVYPKGV